MKLFSRIKYRHKVAAVIFLFILLPFLILSMFIVKKSWDDKVDIILEQNKSELRIGVEAINTLFLSGLQKLSFISINSIFTAYLDKGDFSDFVNNMTVYNNMKRTIDALVIDSSKIGFVIYPVNEDVYNGGYIEKLEQLEKRLSKDEPGLMQQLHSLDWDKQLWRYEKEKRAGDSFNNLGYICCYKKMQLLNKTLAITEMHISMSKVLGYIKGAFPDGSCIIYKPDDQKDLFVMKIVNPDFDRQDWNVVFDTSKLNTGNYYPIEMKLNYSSGAFTLFIPRSYIMSTLPGFLLISVFVTVLSIFILFLIVELASYLITKRLSRLIDRVTMNIENSNTTSDSDRHSTEDDLGRMEDKFYDMLAKIREFYKSMLGHENEKKTFELELLQSRINPHFLYNTLSTMKWSCKNEKMADIIDSMVLYYRLALNKGDTIIKISHEMKLVEEYLKIQKYTYESDFIYMFDVDDDVMESLTIRHLLQPVVENSVLHGINGLESGGIIRISGKLNDGIITLTVSDNGVGMTEDTVHQLLYGEYKSKMGGYGIRNVQRRINLFYGPDFTMNITSVLEKGTTVVIAVPALYQDKAYDSNSILL